MVLILYHKIHSAHKDKCHLHAVAGQNKNNYLPVEILMTHDVSLQILNN